MFADLFSKKMSLKESGFFEGRTEWHCHLLPGVDDGVQVLEDDVKILSYYEELGFAEIWITSHIMEDVPNVPADLLKRFAELESQYKGGMLPGLKGNIKLHMSAENMLDNLFEERLEAGDLLPLGEEGNQLLVETSFFNPPFNFYDLLEKIKSKGYFPMLAHPERYRYMEESDYDKLKKMGVRFQLNLPSLSGMYGQTAQKKAEMLLKKGYYDICGCDTHRLHQIQSCASDKISPKLIKMAEKL